MQKHYWLELVLAGQTKHDQSSVVRLAAIDYTSESEYARIRELVEIASQECDFDLYCCEKLHPCEEYWNLTHTRIHLYDVWHDDEFNPHDWLNRLTYAGRPLLKIQEIIRFLKETIREILDQQESYMIHETEPRAEGCPKASYFPFKDI